MGVTNIFATIKTSDDVKKLNDITLCDIIGNSVPKGSNEVPFQEGFMQIHNLNI